MAADITLMRTPAETRLGEQFAARKTAGDALAARRQEAFGRFSAAGLPHRRIEAWHYTDLRGLMREALPPAGPPEPAAVAAARTYLEAADAPVGARLVMLDGDYRPDLSRLDVLAPGVSVRATTDVLAEGPSLVGDLLAAENLGTGEAILALNAAFMQGGVVLSVAEGVQPGPPIELLCLATASERQAVTTRSLVQLAPSSSLTLLERHVALGQADQQGNHVVVFAVGDGAAVDHVADIQGFSPASLHLGSVLARVGASARFASFTLVTAPGVTRRQSLLEFVGEHSSANFRGVSLLDGRCHADTTLVVTHTAPHCESREYYKTILDGESTGIYQGKVVVAPGAQKTDGKMLSKAIFLAEGASMYNKPELEIFADDVVCGHGATVGYLDDDQLFYLRSRGIPLRQAQSILLNAFAADAIEGVATEAVRDALTRSVEQWMGKRHA